VYQQLEEWPDMAHGASIVLNPDQSFKNEEPGGQKHTMELTLIRHGCRQAQSNGESSTRKRSPVHQVS
jgi:hypothetical protein